MIDLLQNGRQFMSVIRQYCECSLYVGSFKQCPLCEAVKDADKRINRKVGRKRSSGNTGDE